MACQGCINRQRKLVEKVCSKTPGSWLCRYAAKRLAKMLQTSEANK